MRIIGYITVIWLMVAGIFALVGLLPPVEHHQYPGDRPFMERAK